MKEGGRGQEKEGQGYKLYVALDGDWVAKRQKGKGEGHKKENWGEETYSALDGSEGKHVLGSVAAVSTPGLVARVVTLLQDKLLSLELGVLITHPTR